MPLVQSGFPCSRRYNSCFSGPVRLTNIVEKVTEKHQVFRTVGSAVSWRTEYSEKVAFGEKTLPDGDDLFSALLLQICVETCEISRVVEVKGVRPQFTHLLRDAFQYEPEFDVFLVGSAIVSNPSPALQQYPVCNVSPVHTQRRNTRWEQTFWGMIHPHPQAHVLTNLVPQTSGFRSHMPLAHFSDKDLAILVS